MIRFVPFLSLCRTAVVTLNIPVLLVQLRVVLLTVAGNTFMSEATASFSVVSAMDVVSKVIV